MKRSPAEQENLILRGEIEALSSAAAHERAAQKDWARAYSLQGQRLALVEDRVSRLEDAVARLVTARGGE